MEGIERLKVLSADVKDEALLEIIKYLMSRKDMNEKYLNEEKSLKQMIDFITEQARTKAINNRAIIKEDVVHGWAIHYWDEPNEKLNLEKVAKDDKKTSELKKDKVVVEKKPKEKTWVSEGQLSLFDM